MGQLIDAAWRFELKRKCDNLTHDLLVIVYDETDSIRSAMTTSAFKRWAKILTEDETKRIRIEQIASSELEYLPRSMDHIWTEEDIIRLDAQGMLTGVL